MADLLVVGHVTRDLVVRDGVAEPERLGGAASYAAAAALARGCEVALVTSAPPGFALATALLGHPRLKATVLPAREATTFRLVYAGPERTVHRIAAAEPLDQADVFGDRGDAGAAWRAPVVYLAPVSGEIAPYAALAWPEATVVAGLQGWMRDVDDDGAITAVRPPSLRGLAAAVFSEHDHPDAMKIAADLARTVPIVVVTHGARGATLLQGDELHAIPASPATEVDPTGAGDVFGAVLALELGAGRPAKDAALTAAEAAARAVERQGI